MRYCFFLCIFVLSLFCVAAHSEGNQCTPLLILSGGTPLIKFQHEIALKSEEVIIRPNRSHCVFDAVFVFFNKGETVTEWVCFPKTLIDVTPFMNCASPKGIVLDEWCFAAWVDGREMDFSKQTDFFGKADVISREEITEPERLRACLAAVVTFTKHSVTSIRVRYKVPYFNQIFYSFRRSQYLVNNGGTAVFIVDASDIGGMGNIRVTCEGAGGPNRISDNLARYEIKDFSPSQETRLKIIIGRGHVKH